MWYGLVMLLTSRALHRVGQRAGLAARRNEVSSYLIRRQSSIAQTGSTTDPKLPLSGYRVLDMTRVLAGVGYPAHSMMRETLLMTAYSRIALKF